MTGKNAFAYYAVESVTEKKLTQHEQIFYNFFMSMMLKQNKLQCTMDKSEGMTSNLLFKLGHIKVLKPWHRLLPSMQVLRRTENHCQEGRSSLFCRCREKVLCR